MFLSPKSRLAILLVLAPILANAAFFGLGSAFNYPDILQEPAEEILRQFIADQGVIMVWFFVLAVSAGLMAPISVLLRRFGISRLTMWVGVAAASVQVIGLSRWLFLVPRLAASDDTATFEALHLILGTIVGETFGYLLTGAWTILLVRELGGVIAARWFSFLGTASAILILVGTLIPFGVPGADLANFIGYVVWSFWLIILGVIIWRKDFRTPKSA